MYPTCMTSLSQTAWACPAWAWLQALARNMQSHMTSLPVSLLFYPLCGSWSRRDGKSGEGRPWWRTLPGSTPPWLPTSSSLGLQGRSEMPESPAAGRDVPSCQPCPSSLSTGTALSCALLPRFTHALPPGWVQQQENGKKDEKEEHAQHQPQWLTAWVKSCPVVHLLPNSGQCHRLASTSLWSGD